MRCSRPVKYGEPSWPRSFGSHSLNSTVSPTLKRRSLRRTSKVLRPSRMCSKNGGQIFNSCSLILSPTFSRSLRNSRERDIDDFVDALMRAQRAVLLDRLAHEVFDIGAVA